MDDFLEILIPSTVWNEIARHRPSALAPHGLSLQMAAPASALSPDLEVLARTLPLHEGERDALAVARERNADLLLTDDTAARLAGQALGIRVHGTIGVRFRAIRRGRMTGVEVSAVLRSIPTVSTLHIKRGRLAEFIRRAESSR